MSDIGKVLIDQAHIEHAINALDKAYKMLSKYDEANSLAQNEESVAYSPITLQLADCI